MSLSSNRIESSMYSMKTLKNNGKKVLINQEKPTIVSQ